MQKWMSLAAVVALIGCAATPPDSGAFRLEAAPAADETRQVQQVFNTPTPVPTTTLNPLEAAKSNKLIDQAVLELTTSSKELTTRLTKERDRNLQVFAVPIWETGASLPASTLAAYKRLIDAHIELIGLNAKTLQDELLLSRNQDSLTTGKAIMKAKQGWYRMRFSYEKRSVDARTLLSKPYTKLLKERRKALR